MMQTPDYIQHLERSNHFGSITMVWDGTNWTIHALRLLSMPPPKIANISVSDASFETAVKSALDQLV